MTQDVMKGKDLKKEAPRSPYEKIAGFVILARAIDKCRATIANSAGEYEFDCPLDNMLFDFKGIKGSDFKEFVETGVGDDEIGEWLKNNGIPKTDVEIAEWSKMTEAEDYSSDPENKVWLEGENARLGLSKDGTLFDFLDADDKASFPDVCPIK